MTTLPWLSVIIFLPWLLALVVALLPKTARGPIRALSLVGSLSTLALALVVAGRFEATWKGYQCVEHIAWIRGLNVSYHLGVDGMSLLLVILTGIVGPVALLASGRERTGDGVFASLFLLLQGSALGVFLSLDFFPWFVFWETSLIPGFFLMKLWGGREAGRAAYQFVVYTIAGSALLLLSFGALYATVGTGDFVELAALAAKGEIARLLGPTPVVLVFAGVFAGVAVKAALFPFHTWLPSAYAEAPTGASMFFTAVLSKMGVYGFLRLLWPIFPAQLQALALPLLVLALAGVVFGALAAMRQTDLKRMVAYSSVNHVSYCLLALFAVAAVAQPNAAASTAALTGALLQMFNHGLSAAALFAVVGMLETRTGVRGLSDFGGVRTVTPVFAGLAGVALFSSLGLPGLNGFIGEFLIFRGVFGLVPWAAAVACIGLLATAWFLLTFYQRVFSGPVGSRVTGLADVSGAEIYVLVPLAGLMVLLGVWPQWLTALVGPLVNQWVLSLP